MLSVDVASGPPVAITIAGELDLMTVPEACAAFSGLSGDVLVDATGIAFIDSAKVPGV